MIKLLIGYTLAIGLWFGSVRFVMLVLKVAATLPTGSLPKNILLFSLGAVLIMLPVGLIIWSIRGIKKGAISKAGWGITIIAGLYIVFLLFIVGMDFSRQKGRILNFNDSASWITKRS